MLNVSLMTNASPNQIPSLDGIRAVAVLIVFVSHLHIVNLIPGGFGVTLFFFLSGYLITTLLAREFDKTGQIALGHFYLRRLLRLSPPLLITLALAIGLHFAGLVEGQVDPGTVLSQIFYYYNYWSLHFGPTSGGGPVAYGQGDTIPGLGLLWSLSIEEHFYLIWPAIFVLVARKSLTLTHITIFIVVVLLWRTFRFLVIGSDPWTIYSSTDTRIDMLLFGCLLALLSWRRDLRQIAPQGVVKYLIMAGACLAILASFAIRDELFRSSLRFTIQGLALMPLFYYAVTNAGDLIFRPLNWGPVRRIGAYSYTIYLSHHVIILLLLQMGIARLGELKMALLSGAITLIYAALMHRFVEQPCHELRRRIGSAPA